MGHFLMSLDLIKKKYKIEIGGGIEADEDHRRYAEGAAAEGTRVADL